MTDVSILIVGAGPVGMTLAALLARNGAKARIIEKKAIHSYGSKALGINSSSMKVFHQLGLVERVIERGKRLGDIQVHWNGSPIIHVDCARVQKTPYPFSVTLPQPETEKILTAHLRESYGIEIERSVELRSLVNASDGVDVVLEHAKGTIENSRFDFVVGCDGSRSTVRTSLGVGFQGHNYQSFIMLIDAHIDWQGKRPGHADYFVRDSGFVIIIPLPGDLYRFVICESGSSLEQMNQARTLDEYQSVVDRFVPNGVRLQKIVWESRAPLYNRLADSFGKGRVLLVGDAAHLFSPIGGLGMNTGIQDAASLAWRLVGVSKRRYAISILDDYRRERRAMAARLVSTTDEMTSLITCDGPDLTKRAQGWMPTMKNRDSMRRRWPLTFTGLGQRYGVPADVAHPLVGGHIPFVAAHNADGAQANTYQLIRGWRPLLLAFAGTLKDGLNLADAARDVGIDVSLVVANASSAIGRQDVPSIIVDFEGAYRRAFFANDGDVFVLRPDGYIADLGRLSTPTDCILRALRVCTPIDMDVPCHRRTPSLHYSDISVS